MGLLGAVGSVVGGILGNNAQKDMFNQSMALSREQLEYQKQLHQNQIQWRVEDAKKAGVHPMAALGLSSMSFSPVSGPSGGGVDYNWLGEAGQNIDRAIQQGKTREERAQAQALQDKLTDIQIRKGEADADLAETEAATARYRLQRELFPSPPPAEKSTGLIGGQGDAKDPEELFTFGVDGDGKVSRVYPTDFMTSSWEDKPLGSDLAPLAEAEKLEQDAKLNGTIVSGRVWSPSRGEFVLVNSRDGQRALAHWRNVGSVPRSKRALVKYPRSKMNSLDKRFFDWVDRLF